MTRRAQLRSVRGYAGVAVYRAKTASNIGTLWRTAHVYDAALLATVGHRYQHQATDTSKAPRSVPLHHYTDIDDLVAHLPDGCQLVGVELDERATPLHRFQHPKAALYCHRITQVHTPIPWSLNVATAGALVLDDRHRKSMKPENDS